jgi:hypothetical protein
MTAEPGDVGDAEALLLGAVHDVHPVVLGCHLVGEFPGAVGAAVVHDEHVYRGQRGVQPADDRPEVVALVVRWDHHQYRVQIRVVLTPVGHACPPLPAGGPGVHFVRLWFVWRLVGI